MATVPNRTIIRMIYYDMSPLPSRWLEEQQRFAAWCCERRCRRACAAPPGLPWAPTGCSSTPWGRAERGGGAGCGKLAERRLAKSKPPARRTRKRGMQSVALLRDAYHAAPHPTLPRPARPVPLHRDTRQTSSPHRARCFSPPTPARVSQRLHSRKETSPEPSWRRFSSHSMALSRKTPGEPLQHGLLLHFKLYGFPHTAHII